MALLTACAGPDALRLGKADIIKMQRECAASALNLADMKACVARHLKPDEPKEPDEPESIPMVEVTAQSQAVRPVPLFSDAEMFDAAGLLVPRVITRPAHLDAPELDNDLDGVPNEKDRCPDFAPASKEQGLFGCPPDFDGDSDGVPNWEDQCPQDYGSKDFAGCFDSDWDLVPDREDLCPVDEGSLETFGCPDPDGDGFILEQDLCPNHAQGRKGRKGCPPGIDEDRDGAPNESDQCPDQKGPSRTFGCPDSDRDAIADKDDQCPEVRGPKGARGCPDSDGDNIKNEEDHCPSLVGFRFLNGCPPDEDRDKDGTPSARDDCPDEAGKKETGGCPEKAGKK